MIGLNHDQPRYNQLTRLERALIVVVCIVLLCPFSLPATIYASATIDETNQNTDIEVLKEAENPLYNVEYLKEEPTETNNEEVFLNAELAVEEKPDSALNTVVDENNPYGLNGKKPFNPDPTRAVWLSALLPGLGQIYNRRYWKLPIIIGGFMGLGYATSWNNTQYRDYSQGYRDLLDADPATNSYMNFFPPTTTEDSLDKSWLQKTMKSRKDYYRRNRDLCIICMVALYMLCMVDAYVDASLAHFDISPNVSMDVQPAMFVNPSDQRIALGMNWALNF